MCIKPFSNIFFNILITLCRIYFIRPRNVASRIKEVVLLASSFFEHIFRIKPEKNGVCKILFNTFELKAEFLAKKIDHLLCLLLK